MILDKIGSLKLPASTSGAGPLAAFNEAVREKLTAWLLAQAQRVLEAEGDMSSGLAFTVATLLRNKGDHDGALEVWQKIVPARVEVFGENHANTLGARGNLANVLKRMGDMDGAFDECEAVVEGLSKTLGADHPDTLGARINMAGLLSERGDEEDYEKAGVIYKEVIAMYEANERIGPDHLRTLNAKQKLAAVYEEAGDLDEALYLLEAVVPKYEAILGKGHVETLWTKGGMADCLVELDDKPRAKEVYSSAIADGRAAAKAEVDGEKLKAVQWLQRALAAV